MTDPATNPPPTMASTLRELGAFLRRPVLLTPEGLSNMAAWRRLAVLAALHVAGLLLLVLPIISWWQRHFALPTADAFGQLPQGWLIPLTVLVAPLLEETVFRGWQTGRPRALWLLVCMVAGIAVLALGSGLPPLVRGLILLALLVAGLAGWLWLRKRGAPPRLYRAAFPAVFWLATFGFAAAHLANYPSISLLALPMVLPQLWAGALLGFTRQRLGLPAAILQHAIANALTVALAMAG